MKSRKFTFKTFLLIFAAILLLFWAVIVGYVHHCMKIYEAAQPERRIEEVLETFRSGHFGEGSEFLPTCSRFEDPEAYREEYRNLVMGKELTYRKAPGSYDASAPLYYIYAGDTRVAELGLREKSSKPLMLILTLQEWEVASLKPVFSQGAMDYTVLIPEGYSLYVNNILADEREETGNREQIEALQEAAAYVEVPALVEYRIEGLGEEPTFEVRSPGGTAVEPTETGKGSLRYESFAPAEMDGELKAFALKNAKDYSNFFSKDLPGATASIACIRHLFPADSSYLELGEQYRLHDMWTYSAHTAPVFSNERVENYIRYTDDLFSCDVSFDKEMYLYKIGQNRLDQVHTRYYYVNINGSWVIADMRQIIEE